jgi:hypothetical protein
MATVIGGCVQRNPPFARFEMLFRSISIGSRALIFALPIPSPQGRRQLDTRNATMQKPALAAIAAALAFASPAFADHAHHGEMGQEVKTAPAKPENTAATVRKMQENVNKMQAQLDRVANAKTDEERQKAMAEHMQTMHENMKLARGMKAGMMHCPMMEGGMMHKGGMGMTGGGMMGGGMGMIGGGAQPGGSPERMQQLEKRMDMMQMMMEQMMRRQEGQQPAPVK